MGLRERLLDRWRASVHPAASRGRVGAAFALIAGGTLLAILGVLVVAFGDALIPRPSWLRETGFVAAATGLPLFLTGLVAGLPSRRWSLALAGLGLGASFAGIGIFAWLYPDRWYLTVQTPNTYALGSYLVGVCSLAASAAGSLAASLVERHRPEPASEQARKDPVTEEEILEDLAWSEEQGWSWGGIKRRRDDTKVQLKPETERVDFVGEGKRFVVEEDESAQTQAAVQALATLRGEKKASTDEAVGTQVGQLKALQASQRAQQRSEPPSWWQRILAWVRGLFED